MAVQFSHEAGAATRAVPFGHSELVPGLSITSRRRHRLTAGGARRIIAGICNRRLGRLIDRHMAGNRIGLTLTDVRHTLAVVSPCPVGAVDRTPKRTGKA